MTHIGDTPTSNQFRDNRPELMRLSQSPSYARVLESPPQFAPHYHSKARRTDPTSLSSDGEVERRGEHTYTYTRGVDRGGELHPSNTTADGGDDLWTLRVLTPKWELEHNGSCSSGLKGALCPTLGRTAPKTRKQTRSSASSPFSIDQNGRTSLTLK